MRLGACAHCARIRRAGRVRRVDHRNDGTGGRSRGRQGRQQRGGRRVGGARNGESVAAPGLDGARAREPVHRARSLARRLALQALYQLQINPRTLAGYSPAVRGGSGSGAGRSRLFPGTDGGDRAELARRSMRSSTKIQRDAPAELDPIEHAAVLWLGLHELRPRIRSCPTGSRSPRRWNSPSDSARPTATSSSTPCWIAPRRELRPLEYAGPRSIERDTPLFRAHGRRSRRCRCSGWGDDAALLRVPEGADLVAAVDTLVEAAISRRAAMPAR